MNIHAIFPKLQTAVFGRAGVWLIVLALSAILCGALLLGSLPHQPAQAAAPRTAAGQSQPIEPGQTPDGLSAAEWNGIQAQIAAGKYRAYASAAGGFVSANPAHGWQIAYGADGVTRLTPRQAGDWQVGLQLTGYGYEADRSENLAGLVPTLAADGQTLTYRWDDNLSEWWVNRANGLEQGFTLRARPGTANGQPLALELAVTGSLTPAQNGGGVAFLDDRGASVLTYDKLLVTDANGKTIPARFSLSQGERAGVRGNALRIVVDDTHAAYPLTIDPLFQQAYLKASNTEMNDSFGASVAVSGDTLVVGAPYEASNATGVNGNQADNSAAYAGAAYVFTRSGGIWSQQAYLKASNTGASDFFGWSVAVSGDTLVVGALYESSNATGVNGNQADNSAAYAGAAYVFTRSGGVWSQQAYLKASNTGASDFFGWSVAVSGDTLVAGASGEDSNATGVNGNQADNSAAYAGAAYVFTRSGGVWSQQAYLKASNTGASDFFGWSVAVSGDTLVAGAYGEASNATGVNGSQADNSAAYAGAAYVFTRSGGVWSQQAYLKASNTGADDYFGYAVAVDGDTVVVGAPYEASNATGVNGNQADNSAYSAGAAYVFTRSGGVWSQQAYLKASNTEAWDNFGTSVAVSGDTLVVEAPYEASNATGVNGDQTDNSAGSSGAAYVFTRSGGVWSQQAYLKASNTEANDYFGYAVAVDGDTVVVGAPYEDSNATGVNGNQADNSAYSAGAAYVFAEGFCSQQSGAFSSAATWRGGAAPGSSDLACVSSGHTVTLGAAAAVGSLRVYPGGALDLATYGFSAESGVTNDGVISQTQTVNNASVEFVRIQNAAATATQYRGLLVDATANAQNLGAVSVGVRELNTGEYCTTTGAGSPVYARRCYTIVPATQPAAAVRLRLYARTADELNGIAQANLSVYRFAGGWNELLTNRAAGSDGGAYSYAEGDTTGFSAFLLGQTGNVPTAITLQAFTANSSGKLGLAALVWVAALVSLAGLRLRRRRQV
jgi:hypothetical protein